MKLSSAGNLILSCLTLCSGWLSLLTAARWPTNTGRDQGAESHFRHSIGHLWPLPWCTSIFQKGKYLKSGVWSCGKKGCAIHHLQEPNCSTVLEIIPAYVVPYCKSYTPQNKHCIIFLKIMISPSCIPTSSSRRLLQKVATVNQICKSNISERTTTFFTYIQWA